MGHSTKYKKLLDAATIAHKVLKDFIEYAPAQGVMVSEDIQTAFLLLNDALDDGPKRETVSGKLDCIESNVIESLGSDIPD